MSTWYSPQGDLPLPRPGLAGTLVALLRGGGLVTVLLLSIPPYLLLRLLEWPLAPRRPFSSRFRQIWARASLFCLGIAYRQEGQAMRHAGAIVSNHVSWSDIFVLSAAVRAFFVSKDDVASWPVIGLLARLEGTLFIRRDRRETTAQLATFRQRLDLGHRLLFFPEGTSSDGCRVLPFKTTLFAAFTHETLRDDMWVQPVTLLYRPPAGRDPRSYGWFGEMPFGGHMLHVISSWRRGGVRVVFHDPLRCADFDHRRALSQHAENAVRGSFARAGISPPEEQTDV